MPVGGKYDVVILGAGPAGTACALTLKKSGLKVAIIDKASFPRDKICGDAVPGGAWPILKALIPECEIELQNLPSYKKLDSCIVNHNNRAIGDIFWVNKAVNIKRIEFDNYLFEKVLESGSIDVFQETKVTSYRKQEKFELTTNNGGIFECQILVAADGANSPAVKALSNITHDNKKYISVRSYFKNLDFDSLKNYGYSRNELEGYFWVFPLGGNQFNVGIGYNSEVLPKGKSPQLLLKEFIEGDPDLVRRFKNSTSLCGVKGHKIPAGGKKQKYVQDGFLPIGDAAFLTDPMYGHGIDKALRSGKVAGELIIDAFKAKDFSQSFLQQYDRFIHQDIYPELRKSFFYKRLWISQSWIPHVFYPLLILLDKRFKKPRKY